MSEDLVQCVRTAGFEMEYAKFGNGPRALVIIPGLAIKSVMKSAASLQVPYKMFTEGYTLYFFDRRKDVDPGYSLEEMACDQVLAMQALGLKDVALYGVSQGTPAAFNRATILSEATGRTTRSSLAASTSTGHLIFASMSPVSTLSHSRANMAKRSMSASETSLYMARSARL